MCNYNYNTMNGVYKITLRICDDFKIIIFLYNSVDLKKKKYF